MKATLGFGGVPIFLYVTKCGNKMVLAYYCFVNKAKAMGSFAYCLPCLVLCDCMCVSNLTQLGTGGVSIRLLVQICCQ